jgi:DNA sulfur modification protein DndD
MTEQAQSELLFIRLELQDFRQYLGSHAINFSTNAEKHLTLVHAENSVGKTTMLNSIKWCLYGETPEFSDKKGLVSDRANKNTCKVRLNFNYAGNEYSALRVYDQRTYQSKLTLTTIEAGSKSHQPYTGDPNALINEILPQELSNYFLFAGERFSRALGEGNDISHHRAIRDILGFTLAESVIEDVEYLKRRNKKNIKKILEADEETKALGRQLDKLEDQKTGYKRSIKILYETLEENKKVKVDNLKKIEDSGNVKAQALEKGKVRIDTELKRHNISKNVYLKRRQGLIRTFGYILFGIKLTKKKYDFIKDNQREIPSPYAENIVNRLINNKECICGREIKEGSPEEQKLFELKTNASTDKIDKRVTSAISQGGLFKQRSKEFLNELKVIETELQKINAYIGSLEKEDKQNSVDLEAIGNADITEYSRALDEAETVIQNINRDIGFKISDQKANNNRLVSLETEIKQIKINNNELDECKKFDYLADQITKELEKLLKVHELNSINEIRKKVQENIDDSLRKSKEVVVTSDYKFELKDSVTGRIDQGSDGGNGQTLLSNLSFISALIETSKERAKPQNKSIFLPGTIAPFVIDAPFAEMDPTYRLNTFEFLPKQSHQLIIFISTGQWQTAFEDIIGKYIGKRYILINHDMTKNFKENILTINEKDYHLNVASDDSSQSSTSIKEI